MAHLQIASWREYQGPALVSYDLIDIHPEKRKFFLEQDAKWWENKLKHLSGHDEQVAHAPIIAVRKKALKKARRRSQHASNNQTPPALFFKKGEMLCLDGQSRISAARNCRLASKTNGFGVVHIILDRIDDAKQNEILNGPCLQIPLNCGRLYNTIKKTADLDAKQGDERLKSMLGPGQWKGLMKLRRCKRFSDAYDKVTEASPAMAYGFPFGKVRAYHATLCECSIERYLVGYIFAFWENVTRQSQFPLDEIPSEAFEKLQGLMPGVSKEDRKDVHKVFSRPSAFGNFSEDRRDALKDSILETYCMIPSMALFANHMRILEKLSVCMKELLEIGDKHGKRGQGCVKPLENVLRELYTAGRNNRDEYHIQTMSGWRTIYAPFEDRQELSCRQLWLFVMRHEDPPFIDPDHLAYVAKQLGFYSSLIEVGASNYASSDHAEPSPISWVDYSVGPAEQPLGPKGGGWLAKSRQARKYLFFDVAETIGTRAIQRAQESEAYTSLIELTYIYRAFFGHPFLPSRYAERPPVGGDVNSACPALANTGNEHSALPRESPDRGQNSQIESIGDGEIIFPDGDSQMTPSERRVEGQSGLEGYNCLPLCETPEGEDLSGGSSTPHGHDAMELVMEWNPSTESSPPSHGDTAEPGAHRDRSSRSTANPDNLSQSESQKARSSTWNDGCSAGPGMNERCSAGSHAPKSFGSIASETRYPSIADRLPSSPLSGSVLARSESNDSTLRERKDRLAGISNTNGQTKSEPEAQCNRLSETSTPTSSCDSPIEPEVHYQSVSGASYFSPEADPSRARGDIEGLNWLDLAHLQPPERVQPTVEGLRGSCPPLTGSLPSQVMLDLESTAVPPLDPSTKIETQEHRDQRPTGEGDDRADRTGSLNQPESVLGETLLVSPDTVEEWQGSLSSTTAGGGIGEEMLKQDGLRVQSATDYVASALGQTDQVKPTQQAQPKSEKDKPAGAVLEKTPTQNEPTEQRGPDERTYHSDPINVDFRYGCQECRRSSSFGDTRHYDDTASVLSPGPFTGEESDREGGWLKTTDATNLTSDLPMDNSINSAPSSAKRNNHGTIEEIGSPNSTRNEARRQNNREASSETPIHRTPSESDVTKEGDCDHHQYSEANKILARPKTSHALRTPSDSAAAVQEQSDEATWSEVLPPKTSPTGPDLSPGSHAQSLQSAEDSPASSRVDEASLAEEVNEAIPVPTEQHGDLNVPKTTEHHHVPCSPLGSQQGSSCAQNEPTQRPQRVSQRELYKENDGRADCSNWRHPYVEDVVGSDNTEDGSLVEEPVSHPPTSSPTGRDEEPPVKSTAHLFSPTAIEEPQAQGPPGDYGGTNADKETYPNEDRTAAEENSPPSPPTIESHQDRLGVPKEPSGNRKRPISGVDMEGNIVFTTFAKRKCIESPVKERLDGDNRIYWPRSLASFEKLYNHLQGSTLPASEDIAFEPAPQQCGGHTESFAPAPNPGPVYIMPTPLQADGSFYSAAMGQPNWCQTPYEGIQSENHTDTMLDSRPDPVPDDIPSAQGMRDSMAMPHDNIFIPCPPNSCYESGATAVPTETGHLEPATQFAGDASTAAASPQRGPSTGHLPADPISDNVTDVRTAQTFGNAEDIAHYPQDPPPCGPFQKNASSTKVEQPAAQDPVLDAQSDQTVQRPSPDQPLWVNDGSGSGSLQANVPRPEPASTEAVCPTAATKIPAATSPLAFNNCITIETIDTPTTHAPVTEPSAAFNPRFTSAESPQMGDPKHPQRFDSGQQNQTDHQPVESMEQPRKRRLTSPCVPLETTDDYTSHRDAPAPRKDNLKRAERMCHQNGDPIMDSASVSDANTHMDDDAHMDDDVHMEGNDYMENNNHKKRSGHMEDNVTVPAPIEIPNKRFCLGLDSPQGLRPASEYNANDTQVGPMCDYMPSMSPVEALDGVDVPALQSASGFIFIVELDGEEVTFVHRRARGIIRPWHERHLRLCSKSGNFFNRLLRIVEIDPKKSGAIPIDRFFQTEDVLVFQHSDHHEAKVKRLVKKIDRAVRSSEKAALRKSVKKRYYLRARKRRKT